MKAIELIYNLRTNLKQAGSQLEKASDQHIMYMLDGARAVLASRKMSSGTDIIQMSQFVDVKPVEAKNSEIGQVGSQKVLKLVIPKPITYENGEGVLSVGSTDGTVNYTKITYSGLQTCLHRKYTAAEPKWFTLDDCIYIINAPAESVSKVRVRAVYDEPYKVEQVMGRYKYLKPFDWEYPLTLKDADSVYKIAMSGDLGWGDTAIQAVQTAQNKQKKSQEIINALGGAQKQEE